MNGTRETRAWLGALLALQLVTSMTGILLIQRMGPAIERIIDDNVFSTAAVEQMLVSMATPEGDARFAQALERAKGNVTEPEEVPLLHTIERWDDAALAGEGTARAEVLEALQDLSQVNRTSMLEADEAATRLSIAGAWAMVLMGLMGFLASMAVWRRIDWLLLKPIQEVSEVVREVRAGRVQRRCMVAPVGSGTGLFSDVNWLLDQHHNPRRKTEPEPDLRRALISMVDRAFTEPAVVGTVDGKVLTANQAALAANIPAGSIARSVSRNELPEGWEVESLGEQVWLARRVASPT
jgi:hypothetical protein